MANLPGALRGGLDTKIFADEEGCLERIPDFLSQINSKKLPALLVYDNNTKKAAGQKVADILSRAKISFTEKILSPDSSGIVSPDYTWVIELRDLIKSQNVFPIAVGSGVVNDLVKRSSFEAETPYLCVGTASSMDGYASFGAALVKDGYKVTLPCTAPAAVAADPGILRAAPYDMTASGYGDLYAKLASGVDWILADRLGLEPIHTESWDLVQKELPDWIGSPEKLKAGDTAAFSGLFRGLTMSGIAMQVYKDSRVASGAEHLVSHIWEMAHLSRNGLPVSHGFKVAMGTVLSVSLMEFLYHYPPGKISVETAVKKRQTWEEREESVRRAFPDKKTSDQVLEVCRLKWPDEKALTLRLQQIVSLLPEMRKIFDDKLSSRNRVVDDLRRAGCPVDPAEYGVSPKEAIETLVKAQMIRQRYTILDAVYELGLFEEFAGAPV
ncbi:glycerol-1-phosphate dehydrogenase (NAD(P)+) [Spirochaetia bacterium]|nr:glycerol-1-phosphate dehydrogenase (NAD(P)+) [Spirochaetia bacterium]